jgi:hypothetical protein
MLGYNWSRPSNTLNLTVHTAPMLSSTQHFLKSRKKLFTINLHQCQDRIPLTMPKLTWSGPSFSINADSSIDGDLAAAQYFSNAPIAALPDARVLYLHVCRCRTQAYSTSTPPLTHARVLHLDADAHSHAHAYADTEPTPTPSTPPHAGVLHLATNCRKSRRGPPPQRCCKNQCKIVNRTDKGGWFWRSGEQKFLYQSGSLNLPSSFQSNRVFTPVYTKSNSCRKQRYKLTELRNTNNMVH